MRLKSFYAKTMNEAMQMVRDTLGDNAVIVASREENGGGTVHVTAAMDPAFEIGPSRSRGGVDWLQYDSENDDDQIVEDLTDTLLRHAVPEDVIDHIVSCATIVGLDNPENAMQAALEHLFTFQPLPQKPYDKPIMMIGPAASGKTVMTAKAATRAVMKGLSVGLVSCDAVRAGGFEQLNAFAKLLKIDCHRAATPDELFDIVQSLSHLDHIYIDTPGTNPFDQQSIGNLKGFIDAVPALCTLVLPAGLDNRDSGEIARVFSKLGAALLMPSRMDAARRYGGLFAAAHYGGLAFSEAGGTPKIANGLMPITPENLTYNIVHSFERQISK